MGNCIREVFCDFSKGEVLVQPLLAALKVPGRHHHRLPLSSPPPPPPQPHNQLVPIQSSGLLYTTHYILHTAHCTHRYCTCVYSGTVHMYTQVLYTCTHRCSTYVNTGTVLRYRHVLYTCTHRGYTNVSTGTVHMQNR